MSSLLSIAQFRDASSCEYEAERGKYVSTVYQLLLAAQLQQRACCLDGITQNSSSMPIIGSSIFDAQGATLLKCLQHATRPLVIASQCPGLLMALLVRALQGG